MKLLIFMLHINELLHPKNTNKETDQFSLAFLILPCVY